MRQGYQHHNHLEPGLLCDSPKGGIRFLALSRLPGGVEESVPQTCHPERGGVMGRAQSRPIRGAADR